MGIQVILIIIYFILKLKKMAPVIPSPSRGNWAEVIVKLTDRNAGCLSWEPTTLYLTQQSHLTHRKTEVQPVRGSCPETNSTLGWAKGKPGFFAGTQTPLSFGGPFPIYKEPPRLPFLTYYTTSMSLWRCLPPLLTLGDLLHSQACATAVDSILSLKLKNKTKTHTLKHI